MEAVPIEFVGWDEKLRLLKKMYSCGYGYNDTWYLKKKKIRSHFTSHWIAGQWSDKLINTLASGARTFIDVLLFSFRDPEAV